jgi:hypothetical protein
MADGDNDDDEADDNNDNDNHVDDDNDDNDNLPPCIGKRNDGCNKTKMEEEETVTYFVEIHTTIKQITGRGVGRWRLLDDDDDEGSGHNNDNNDDDGRQ